MTVDGAEEIINGVGLTSAYLVPAALHHPLERSLQVWVWKYPFPRDGLMKCQAPISHIISAAFPCWASYQKLAYLVIPPLHQLAPWYLVGNQENPLESLDQCLPRVSSQMISALPSPLIS